MAANTDIGGSGSVLISKLAAAQRQIDAAVRMSFAGEDKLAIYTVAAAALTVLRDLSEERGASYVADLHLNQLVGTARALLEGKQLDTLHSIQEHAPEHYKSIRWLANLMREKETREGRRLTTKELLADFEVTASKGIEAAYVRRINFPANFLKHADRDPKGYWLEVEFDAARVTLEACAAYFSLVHTSTPEMLLYTTLELMDDEGDPGVPDPSFQAVARILQRSPRSERRGVCLRLLREERSMLEDWLRPPHLGHSSSLPEL